MWKSVSPPIHAPPAQYSNCSSPRARPLSPSEMTLIFHSVTLHVPFVGLERPLPQRRAAAASVARIDSKYVVPGSSNVAVVVHFVTRPPLVDLLATS